MELATAIPYIPDLHNLRLESVIGFVLGVLFAVLINAEGQAFMATCLGDQRVGATDRFHFNAFLHLDLAGTLAFLLGGFGWPRQLDVDAGKFEHPVLYRIITRLSGPLANLLLAGVGASMIHLVMVLMALDPHIFLGVIAVNVTVAVYNLIPIPPLALGTIGVELLPESMASLKKGLKLAGPWLIVGVLAYDRIFHTGVFSKYLNPWVQALYNFVTG